MGVRSGELMRHIECFASFFPTWCAVVKNSSVNAGDARDPGSIHFPQEEEMATHSTILWRIPWTEEPGRLQSGDKVSKRVGHD